ncbi:MAG: patatin-like phospholipase family protein [Gallionella sp.]
MGDYKILSLDGGGSWALIQAQTLLELYGDISGRDILRRFDLVAATSGGSLVAGALAAGMKPTEVFELFDRDEYRSKVFVDKTFAFVTRFFGLGPRYVTAKKLAGLHDILDGGSKCGVKGSTPLNGLKLNDKKFPHFLITSFDYDRQRAVFFRSNEKSKAASDPDNYKPAKLAEALHASSTAPVNYFDEPAQFDNPNFARRRFWDGGTAGLNNPVLAGVMEAVANGEVPANIKVMSIGTGSVMLPVEDDFVHPPLAISRSSPGLIADIKKMAKTILADPPDAATYEAYRILHDGREGNPEKIRVVRFSPLIQPMKNNSGQWGLPEGLDEEEFASLVKMDMDAVKQDEVELIKQFCDLWIKGNVRNQPIQTGSYSDLSCKIGQPTFNAAKLAAELNGFI